MMSRTRPTPRIAGARDSGSPPGKQEDGGDGGGGGWRWLVTAANSIEAELMRGYLESAGIPVALDRRDSSPQAWLFLSGNVQAPVRVLVPWRLLEAARLELLESEFAPGAEDASDEEPRLRPARRRGAGWTILAVLSALVVVWLVVLHVFGSATCALRLVC